MCNGKYFMCEKQDLFHFFPFLFPFVYNKASLRSYFYMLYLTHGNILATVHQKASVNYVVEIKTSLIVGKTLINFIKFWRDGAEFE